MSAELQAPRQPADVLHEYYARSCGDLRVCVDGVSMLAVAVQRFGVMIVSIEHDRSPMEAVMVGTDNDAVVLSIGIGNTATSRRTAPVRDTAELLRWVFGESLRMLRAPAEVGDVG